MFGFGSHVSEDIDYQKPSPDIHQVIQDVLWRLTDLRHVIEDSAERHRVCHPVCWNGETTARPADCQPGGKDVSHGTLDPRHLPPVPGLPQVAERLRRRIGGGCATGIFDSHEEEVLNEACFDPLVGHRPHRAKFVDAQRPETWLQEHLAPSCLRTILLGGFEKFSAI